MQVLYIDSACCFKYMNLLFSLAESKPIMLWIQLQTPVCYFSWNKRQTRGFGWMRQTRNMVECVSVDSQGKKKNNSFSSVSELLAPGERMGSAE